MSTDTTPDKPKADVPGGRCYWCASQDHDSDGCVEAQRIMDEHYARMLREGFPDVTRPTVPAAG